MSRIDKSKPTAVLVIGYRRPELMIKVLESIPIDGRKIYLYVGAAKNSEVRANVEATKKLCLDFFDTYPEVKLKFAASEISMEHGIHSAIDWAFEDEKSLIILEDDIVPVNAFFEFVDLGLAVYEDNFDIWQISGFMPLNSSVTSQKPFFGITPTTWGWATWKNRWTGFDLEFGSYSKSRFLELPVAKEFKLDDKRISYWNEIFARCRDEQCHWDYQWYYWMWANGGFALFPGTQLISNIGFGADATHTFAVSHKSWLEVPSVRNLDISIEDIQGAKFTKKIQKNLDYVLTGIVDLQSIRIWLRPSFFISRILNEVIRRKWHKVISPTIRRFFLDLLS